MSGVLTRARLIAQERYDLEDFAADQNAIRTDSKFWTKRLLSGENYVVKGFAVSGIGLKDATVSMENATLLHGQNTFDFSWFTSPDSFTDIIVADANLQDGAKNYLELKLIETPGTPVTKAFWDPSANGGAGGEFNQEINTTVDLDAQVVVSIGGFTGDPDRIPLAIVEVDGSGNIVGIRDKRDLYFSLEQTNDPDREFTWATQESSVTTLQISSLVGVFLANEVVTFTGGATAEVALVGSPSMDVRYLNSDSFAVGNTITGSSSGATAVVDQYLESFITADKDIDDWKENDDAIKTELKSVKGTRQWYQNAPASLVGLSQFHNSQLTANLEGAGLAWNGTELSITQTQQPEITNILAVADVAASLDGTTFILSDVNGTVGFWIDIDDSGTGIPAAASAADRAVEITTIATGDAITIVASKLQVAVNADGEFSATLDSDTVTVTDDKNGLRDASTDVDTGFTISRVQKGLGTLVPTGADVLAKIRLFGSSAELDVTRQDGSGGSVAIPMADNEIMFIKLPTSGSDRVYSGIGSGDTNYQVVDIAAFSSADDIYWIAYRENDVIYTQQGGALETGEGSAIGGGVTNDTLSYIGASSSTDSDPNYSSTEIIDQGDNLTIGVGKLDAQVKTNLDDIVALTSASNQDRNLKLIKGGTWFWDLATTTLSWSLSAFVQVPGLAESVNSIAIGSNSLLTADGGVLYVDINRVAPGGALTVSHSLASALVLTDNIVVIARRVGSDVLVGTGSFLLKDGERLEIEGGLAEINRNLGQLKLQRHNTTDDRATIDGADITQLDASIIGTELNNFFLDFDGSQIDFTTGEVFESDGTTPLGTDFTPFAIPVSEYFWYGIALTPGAVTAINAQEVQVQITPGSASNAAQASAPFPIVVGDLKIGAIQIFNNAGSLEVVAVRRLKIGGSGGGSGDSVAFESEMDDVLNDSFYEYYAPIVFPRDQEDFVDGPNSTGTFVNSDGIYQLEIGEILATTNLFDTEFVARTIKSLQKTIVVDYFDDASRDDGATYEVTIDGGVTYETVTMERQAGTVRYTGRFEVADNATFDDLRLRITASEVETKVENIAIFYNEIVNGTISGILQQQTFLVDGDADQTDFTMTIFLPDVTLTKMRVAETGQTFVSPAFTVNGFVVSVPAGTFDAPGEDFTVIIEQLEGNTFDNSDSNANNIANLLPRTSKLEREVFNAEIEVATVAVPFTTIRMANGQSRQMSDLSSNLRVSMGNERIAVKNLSKVLDEFGDDGRIVHKVDNNDARIRLVGNWSTTVDTHGTQALTSTVDDYVEVTFFGTGINYLTLKDNAARDIRFTIDGGAESADIYIEGVAVLNARNYATNQQIQLVKGLSLGWHTLKLRFAATNNMRLYGFEVVNESTQLVINPGTPRSNSTVRVVPSTILTDYNSDFDTSSDAIGTVGGRVLVYQDGLGVVKKRFKAVGTPLFLGSSDHQDEDLLRTINFREFGANRADDFSTLGGAASDRAFTLDDGTTTLVGNGARTTTLNGVETLFASVASDFISLTFLGTGLDIINHNTTTLDYVHEVFVDGVSAGTITGVALTQGILKLCSGLPYGSHTVKINTNSSAANAIALSDFLIYGPAKPALDIDVIELADYNIMADFVVNTTAGINQMSQGVMRKSKMREATYQVNFTTVAIDVTGYSDGWDVDSSTLGAAVEFTFFGTGIIYKLGVLGAFDVGQIISIDGDSDLSSFTTNFFSGTTGVSFTPATGILAGNPLASSIGSGLEISGLPLGIHTFRMQTNIAVRQFLDVFDIITPIHVNSDGFKIGSQSLSDSRQSVDVAKPSTKNDLDMSKAKAWLIYDGINDKILNSYNVSAIVGSSQDYNIYFKQPFKDSNYVAVASQSINGVVQVGADLIGRDAAACNVITRTGVSGGVDAVAYIVFFGELENEEDIDLGDL